MTEMATAQQQMAEAASSLAAKLQTFHGGLTPDEQAVLELALQYMGAGAEVPEEDASGHLSTQPIGTQPSSFGRLVGTVSIAPVNPVAFVVHTLTHPSNTTGSE